MLKKKDFIVSCQALEKEPLHSSYIMGRMAVAAVEGGADGIRANSVIDIEEIKKNVSVSIIGIVKKDFDDSNVFITPTICEVRALVEAGCDVIAVDATNQIRPGNITLDEFFKSIKLEFPNQEFMADCSTFEEMKQADQMGFDYIGTTLFGYTEYSSFYAFDDLNLFYENTKNLNSKIIAEGNIHTPEQAKAVQELDNIFAVVVGGAITRPQNITKKFVDVMKEGDYENKIITIG